MNTLGMWMDYVDDLARDSRVLLFDYPRELKTNQAQAAGMHTLFERLGIQKPIFVGASDGGIPTLDGQGQTRFPAAKSQRWTSSSSSVGASLGPKELASADLAADARPPHRRPLPRQTRFLLAGKSAGVFRERKSCPERLTKQAGCRPLMRKTKLGAVSAPKNRICPCPSRVSGGKHTEISGMTADDTFLTA